MSAGTRYSQRIQNIAREKQYGMIKTAFDGRYLVADEHKTSVGIEGPASPEKFELLLKFAWLFGEISNTANREAVVDKMREFVVELETQ